MKRNDSLILALLTLTTGGISAWMAWHGRASWLEAVSFVTGAICVWLTVRESIWNFPISLLNVSTFAFLYFESRLFADAGLQVVYFVLTSIGWYLWLYGGAQHTALHVVRASRRELVLVVIACAALTIVLWQTLVLVGGSASFFDAITTSISLGAQWLLNRKRMENWYFWIAADLIYVPLYLYKGLTLTALLYSVFLVMCIAGVQQWRGKLAQT